MFFTVNKKNGLCMHQFKNPKNVCIFSRVLYIFCHFHVGICLWSAGWYPNFWWWFYELTILESQNTSISSAAACMQKKRFPWSLCLPTKLDLLLTKAATLQLSSPASPFNVPPPATATSTPHGCTLHTPTRTQTQAHWIRISPSDPRGFPFHCSSLVCF